MVFMVIEDIFACSLLNETADYPREFLSHIIILVYMGCKDVMNDQFDLIDLPESIGVIFDQKRGV